MFENDPSRILFAIQISGLIVFSGRGEALAQLNSVHPLHISKQRLYIAHRNLLVTFVYAPKRFVRFPLNIDHTGLIFVREL
ncbi:hypothetical protein CN163_33540 [Sinorhizobium meliloti]|nr:hypothetical protein CN163_33540 [Sinorhizobium meliloti]